MPIAKTDKTDEDPYVTAPVDRVKETQPFAVPRNQRTNIIDTRWQPQQDIITHIEGSPWTVYYFSQVVGLDDELTPPTTDQSGANQQYIQIKNLEIRVDSDVSPSQDPQTNEMLLVGGAFTFPFFYPNINDVFFADIGNGKEGAFLVTDVDRKTIFNETTHHIEYTLLTNTDYTALKANVISKVVKTYHFDKYFLQRGKNPLLVDSEFATIEDMDRLQKLLLVQYLNEFYSEDVRTLTIPISGALVYDPLLIRVIQSLTDSNQHPLLRRIYTFNTDDGYALNQPCIWDLLLDMDKGLFFSIFQKTWAIPTASFTRYPLMRGIYHSKFNAVIYPYGKAPFCSSPNSLAGREPFIIDDPLLQDEIRSYFLNGLGEYEPHPTGISLADLNSVPPNIHHVRKDDYYVLSKAFYEEWQVGQSHLELLLHRAINHEAFDTSLLITLCNDTRHWEPLDRFYYTPILLALLKISLQRL